MQIEYLKKCTYASSSSSFLATIRDFKCAASICPSSITNSANASSTSVSVNLSPQVMSECFKGFEDGVIIIGTSSHFFGEECNHLCEVNWSGRFRKHGIGFSSRDGFANGGECAY